MTDTLAIRKANEGDIPFILACEAGPASRFVQGDDEATHRANITDARFTYLIAERSGSGAPLGYTLLVASGDGRTEWRRIIVENPGKGTGKEFMQLVINRTFAAGTNTLWLDVYEDNARAQHVYKSLGFTETHREPSQDNRERELVFMELMRPKEMPR